MSTRRIAIIGGGAAGFFAALQIAENEPDAHITILEASNRLLSKVRISGGGRCNVTHDEEDNRVLAGFYPRGKKELLQVFSRFSVPETVAWFSSHGVEMHIETDGRMFPVSNNSQSVVNCFLDEAGKQGITIRREFRVADLKCGTPFQVISDRGEKIEVDMVLVTAGGHASAAHYSFLRNTGHALVPPVPSLFTFNVRNKSLSELMGISLPSAVVRVPALKLEEHGALLITHWGFSGPAILKLSSTGARILQSQEYRFSLEVMWDENVPEFISSFPKHLSVQIGNMESPFPKRLWHYFLDRAGITAVKRCADISKFELKKLEEVLWRDTYPVDGKTTFKEEFVTCGGIPLPEVDMRTMESKIVSGLFFAGEVLDIDGYTGGYNFQAAWSTAWVAAQGIIASK